MSRPRCKGAGCACADCAPAHSTPTPMGGRLSTRGRFVTEPEPAPQTGYGRLGDRNWTVQAFTGATPSTVPAGRWQRGTLYRAAMPVMHHDATYPGPMYDPTDPRTWPPSWQAGGPGSWLPQP